MCGEVGRKHVESQRWLGGMYQAPPQHARQRLGEGLRLLTEGLAQEE